MITIHGKNHISATIIADSMCALTSTRLLTFELEYPRFIHSEFMTHRQLSKNSASSRAIPIKTMHKHIVDVPQSPVEWGRNQAGMQAKELLSETEQAAAEGVWDAARVQALSHAQILSEIGAHKQIANRVTEPFMQMKVVCSGTEWNNFFWLRDHADADPTIRELAKCMWRAYASHAPNILAHGEWHLPYIITVFDTLHDVWVYEDGEGNPLELEQAKVISASCCAQVSYRRLDDNYEKALMIYEKLIASEPVHASPVEHQATPLHNAGGIWFPDTSTTWPEGMTHVDREGQCWSGNYRNWIQHRQLIPNHSRKG